MTTYEHMLQAHWAAGLAKYAQTRGTWVLATQIARAHARQAANTREIDWALWYENEQIAREGIRRFPRG